MTTMGRGRQLGIQLRQWLESGAVEINATGIQALANRWGDVLGSEEALKAPLRDLAGRPLFRQALLAGGLARRTSLEQLAVELAATYSPQVLAELLDLLEEFAAIELPRSAPIPPPQRPTIQPGRARQTRLQPLHSSALLARITDRAAGIALAAAAALVWMWIGQELDALLFEGWGWSGGAVLLFALALVEVLMLTPLKHRRPSGLLTNEQAGDSQLAWRWVTAPWLHATRSEAILNLMMLAVILGPSALQLPDVLLRYTLASLATLVSVALMAPDKGQHHSWGGASGAVGTLIGLGVGLSVLEGRSLIYRLGPLSIPAWVLLLIYGGLQLSWQSRARHLQRARPSTSSGRWHDILTSPWCWGLFWGCSWALFTRVMQLVESMRGQIQP